MLVFTYVLSIRYVRVWLIIYAIICKFRMPQAFPRSRPSEDAVSCQSNVIWHHVRSVIWHRIRICVSLYTHQRQPISNWIVVFWCREKEVTNFVCVMSSRTGRKHLFTFRDVDACRQVFVNLKYIVWA